MPSHQNCNFNFLNLGWGSIPGCELKISTCSISWSGIYFNCESRCRAASCYFFDDSLNALGTASMEKDRENKKQIKISLRLTVIKYENSSPGGVD